jgi:hypothetical protein
MTRALLSLLIAAGITLGECDQRPATAVLDGGNPYLVYPTGDGLRCKFPQLNQRRYAITLHEFDQPVCLSRALSNAHVAPLLDLQRCAAGEACQPCMVEDPTGETAPSDAACAPSLCFPAPALAQPGSADCWLELSPMPYQAETHYVILQPDPAAPPVTEQQPPPTPSLASDPLALLLPQIVIVSPSAEVQIVPDPIHPKFLLGRFGPRLAGAAAKPGDDCDSGNCGLFPVWQISQPLYGFWISPPRNVVSWQSWGF